MTIAQGGDDYRLAINACVVSVRQQSDFSKFDVYLMKTGELRGWGSEHEMYLFNKCMEQRGFDVQVKGNRR